MMVYRSAVMPVHQYANIIPHTADIVKVIKKMAKKISKDAYSAVAIEHLFGRSHL